LALLYQTKLELGSTRIAHCYKLMSINSIFPYRLSMGVKDLIFSLLDVFFYFSHIFVDIVEKI
jgi:hypothetical protein